MVATCPRRRGNPRIHAAATPPWHLFLYVPPTACVRRHKIAASPHRHCMPPSPSAVWRDGPEDVTVRIGLGPSVSPKREQQRRIDRPCRTRWRRLVAAI
jgi:hypothetical protein